jgi:hypothetical protein
VNPLVGFAIDTYPGVLCVHLIYNPVPLRLRLANDEATEQFVSLLDLFDREEFLGLEGLVEVTELLLSCFLFGRTLVFREVEEGAHLLHNFYQCREGFLDFGSCPLLLDQSQDGDDMDKILLIVPRAVGGHLELHHVRKFNLDLLGVPLLMKISRGSIRDGRPNGQRALLAFGVLQAFRGGLKA